MIKRAGEGTVVRHGEGASKIEGADRVRFMSALGEYLDFIEKVDKRIRNEKLVELLARAELTHRSDFTSSSSSQVPEKLAALHAQLNELAEEFQIKVSSPVEEEEHHTWSVSFKDAQGQERSIDWWKLASSPEFRQMMSKYSQIKEYLEPPFLIEYVTKSAQESSPESSQEPEEAEETSPEGEAVETKAARRSARPLQEPVEKQTAREFFSYVVEQGKKGYEVQRYKGLGEMSDKQLWETTMDPDHRTLLQVRLEDIAECETIFTTLMGEDVEARRKFIEDNALDVKNLDI
jgi:DNA gyrase subunit B